MLAGSIRSPYGENLKEDIQHLLKRKMAGDELDLEPRIQIINDFLDSEIVRLEAYVKTISVEIEDSTQKLDELFRITLKEAWESKNDTLL